MESTATIVELTATDHCGLHKYTYQGAGKKVILFPVSHAAEPGTMEVRAMAQRIGSSPMAFGQVNVKDNVVSGWSLLKGKSFMHFSLTLRWIDSPPSAGIQLEFLRHFS